MKAVPPSPGELGAGFEQLFHANPQPMWIYDVETLAFLDVNEAAVRLYGYTVEEFLAMTIADIRPPSTIAVMHEAVREARARERIAQSGPWHHRTRAGESLFVRASSHGLVCRGRAARLVLVTDITQQIALEGEREAMIEALQTSQERLDAAIAGGNVGLWERNLAARTLSCGGRWAELLGTTAEAFGPVTPQSFFDLCHPDDLERSYVRLTDFLHDPSRPYEDEFRMRHTSGRWVWVLSRGRIAEVGADGRAMRMVGTFVDITDLKAAQAAQAQQRAAEQASAMKSQFLARVSHELRTPLNAVLGFAQLLQLDRDTPLTPAQRDRVTYIEQAGHHLLGLINDLMDLSRIEVGDVEMQRVAIDVAGLLDSCLQMVDAPLRARGLQVARDVAPGLPAVAADALRLRQCVLNLLTNAAKYADAGSTVRIRAAVDADDTVTLSVSNRGEGLTPEQLEQLYQPFNRLGRDDGRVDGTGIGLAITRQLIERMGGRITATSAVGQWVTFSLTLMQDGKVPTESAARNGHPAA